MMAELCAMTKDPAAFCTKSLNHSGDCAATPIYEEIDAELLVEMMIGALGFSAIAATSERSVSQSDLRTDMRAVLRVVLPGAFDG
jgi:hypothetical protein